MKTKTIFALLTTVLLSVASIQAAGLVEESHPLFGPAKACTAQKAAPRPTPPARPQGQRAAANHVLVKLFNAGGELVGQQTVTMSEFMSDDFTRTCLPEGTTFVMFHGSIAYYQTGTGGAAAPGA
ncbi:MAG: hypothetical protein AVDCRST_MAG56-3371 [uncultured Cytophagales bacterium]|uniref:Uncharacterized protein n=1 Tax=uncultured Cytophagales bacterium TaxID=158755 RepID=A0A6J4JFZ7_9SPHI|nr:MAG: hypothetical protein AVDCRST_MAG56-3371 [uncultured Cytophagales bacterium]